MDRPLFRFDFGGFHTEVRFARFTTEASPRTLSAADGNALMGGLPAGFVRMPAGEACKNWSSVEAILARAFELGLDRDSWFRAVGGGAVCDVVAFAASLFMRGCRLELVPTTLLAMVDAAVGGKTAINFGGYKNMVGTFYPAALVSLDMGFLATLSERELLSGLAEVVKTAMLGDAGLLDVLEGARARLLSREAAVFEDVVARCLSVKASFVGADLREEGGRGDRPGREALNLGHTFGHALEACSGLGRLTHGEAVAWGLRRALRAGLRLGLTDEAYARRVEAILDSYAYPARYTGIDPSRVREALSFDKKKRSGVLRFVLQRGAGDTFLSELDEGLLAELLAEGLA